MQFTAWLKTLRFRHSQRSFWLVISGFFATIFFIWLLDAMIIQPNFRKLEFNQAREDMQRAQAAMNYELQHLDLLLSDWSNWDDASDFAQTGDPQFIESNLSDWAVLEGNTRLNLALILNSSEQV